MDINDIDYSNDTSPSIIDVLLRPILCLIGGLIFLITVVIACFRKDEETLNRLFPFPPMLKFNEDGTVEPAEIHTKKR